MTNVGMKPSKKFATGTVHENGSGQFEILDRFMEDATIMLKYKWLTGEFEGQIDTNKEVNVNASIWKFDKVRGKTLSEVVKREDNNFIDELKAMVQDGVGMVSQILENQGYYSEKLHGFLVDLEVVHKRMEEGSVQFKLLNQHIERQNETIKEQNNYIQIIMNTLENRIAEQNDMIKTLIEKL